MFQGFRPQPSTQNHDHFLPLKKQQENQVTHWENQFLYGYPIDIEKCMTHRKANLICKDVYSDPTIRTMYRKKCQCCGKVVGEDPHKQVRYDPLQLAVYGPGIPLYFLFLEYLIKLLVFFAVVFGLYAFITNLQGHDCAKPKRCVFNSFILRQSILNNFQSVDQIETQIYLLGLLSILLIPILQWFRFKIKAQKILSDQILISPSDFAIILRRLPQGTQENDIRRMINHYLRYLSPKQKIQTENLAIHKIMFAHDLQEYHEISRMNLQHFKECVKQYRQFQKIPTPDINEKLSTAIVVFERQTSKNYLTKHLGCPQATKKFFWMGYRPLSNFIQVNSQFINCQRAPQPDDIIWQNCGFPTHILFLRKISMIVLSFFILFLGGFLHYQLAKFRRTFQFDAHLVQQIFSLVSASLITLINLVIEYALIWSSKFQKPDTRTLLKISLTSKIVMLQFINTGIVYLFVAAFIYLPDYRFYKSLIANDIVYIMGMNMVFNNVFNLFWVCTELPNSVYRWQFNRQQKRLEDQGFSEPPETVYTQLEANQLYEAGIVELEYKYAYIFKTLWLTAFFMPTVPSVILISIIGLLINYWTQKLLFSGYYTIPEMFSARLSVAVLDMLNYTPLWMTLGCLFIHWCRANLHYTHIPIDYRNPLYLCLVISLLNIFLPLPAIVKKLFPSKFDAHEVFSGRYTEEKKKFECTYEQTNPAYNGGFTYRPGHKPLQVQLVEGLLKDPESAFFKALNPNNQNSMGHRNQNQHQISMRENENLLRADHNRVQNDEFIGAFIGKQENHQRRHTHHRGLDMRRQR